MRDRRFVFLAAALLTLNMALWLAPQGLALRQMVAANLFGKNMVRLDVVENIGCPTNCVEVREDRGVVVSDKAGVLTLAEADGRQQPINVSSATKVTVAAGKAVGVNGIKAGWRVLVTWPPPNGPAQSVLIEKRGKNTP
jgi:hypothetical protein